MEIASASFRGANRAEVFAFSRDDSLLREESEPNDGAGPPLCPAISARATRRRVSPEEDDRFQSTGRKLGRM
jgi:hypothetical protein